MKIFYILLFAALLSNTARTQDITQGVIAHWQLNDGEAVDLSDNNIEGELFDPESIEDRFGNDEGALLFNGTNDVVVFADVLDEVTTATDAQFAISLWYKSSDYFPALSPLICKYAHSLCGENERQWAFLIEDGFGVRFYYAGTTDNANYRSVSTLNNPLTEFETWYHLVVNYDGSVDTNDGQDRVQLYVDNVLQVDTLNFSVGELMDNIPDGDAPIGLMSYVSIDGDNCGDFNAPGGLDDIRIYDRLLLESEVNLLFFEGIDGVEENEKFDSAIEISPNPISSQSLSIKVSQGFEISTASIYNLTGERIQDIKLGNGNSSKVIQLVDLAPGVYLLHLDSPDGNVCNKRIVIQD